MVSHRRFISTCGAGLAALLVSTSLAEALTVDETWASWQEAAAAGDHPLAVTSTAKDGNFLHLDGLTTSLTLGQREMGISIPRLSLEGLPDGTVAVRLPEKPKISILVGDRKAVLDVDPVKFSVVISGPPGALTHEVQAERLVLALDARDGNGEGDIPLSASLDLGSLSGSFVQRDSKDGKMDVSVGSLDLAIATGDPAGSRVEAMMHLDGLSAEALLHDFADVDFSNLAPRVEAGAKISIKGVIAKTGYEMKYITPEASVSENTLRGVSGASVVDLSLSSEGLRASLSTEGLQAAAKGFDLPDRSGTLAAASFSFVGPILPAEKATAATASVSLQGLLPDAVVWDLFDPSANLDRRPMSLDVDLAALVNPLRNLLDLSSWAGEALPIDIETAELRRLSAQSLGMKFGGTGSARFDNADRDTYPGFPRPEGAISMSFSGAEAALASFAMAGLLSEQKVSAAKFFLAMFATPNGGVDSFATKIEATADGALLANGQRIR